MPVATGVFADVYVGVCGTRLVAVKRLHQWLCVNENEEAELAKARLIVSPLLFSPLMPLPRLCAEKSTYGVG
jgi:hypothetical protein